MKYAFYIACVIIILMAVFGGVEYSEIMESQRIEKQRADKRLKNYQDSMRVVLKWRDEQDLLSIKLIQELTIRDERHAEQINKLKREHEKIRFVRHDSDTAINRAISELYPSFSNN